MTHRLHEPTIRMYYRRSMSMPSSSTGSFSESPLKPRRFRDHLRASPLSRFVRTVGFAPLAQDDFLVAHTERYVRDFFAGREPLASSNWFPWNARFADSVRFTNGSLVAAVLGALEQPSQIALSPTSGFHHARPECGHGYCTFSGQVIAALRAYREHGAVGAWVDLDGHFGDSIEASRRFVPELDAALPFNINPAGCHGDYLRDLSAGLARLEAALLEGRVQYVGFAHGADSHEWDDLGHQVSTAEWLEASRVVYGMIARCSASLGRPVPLVLALFGGYRKDDLSSVLELHVADLGVALSTLCGHDLAYEPRVTRPRGRGWAAELEQDAPRAVDAGAAPNGEGPGEDQPSPDADGPGEVTYVDENGDVWVMWEGTPPSPEEAVAAPVSRGAHIEPELLLLAEETDDDELRAVLMSLLRRPRDARRTPRDPN
jgi:acetoin utilization deacetylase AcuC-like enzyme